MNPYGVLAGTIGLVAVGWLVFRKVRADYRQYGQLTQLSVFLEFLIFAMHGCASYLFLDSNLKNVRVVQGDAMNTKLDAQSMDAVLLFGVIPAPMLPLNRLLPEMHRILKPEGILAVWPPVPVWLPRSILRSGLFTYTCKRNGVFNFRSRRQVDSGGA